MLKHGIPTADYHEFTELVRPSGVCPESPGYPLVIKADGLAARQGVVICPGSFRGPSRRSGE